MSAFTCRAERPADADAIHRIHARAFGREAEADLVRALRAEARPYLGLVAESDGRVVAHVAFSPVSLESTAPLALGLGPLAVEPDVQRTGAGSVLTHAGLAACTRVGAALVFVLGHPTYYPRFGFRPAAPLRYRDLAFDPAFFVLELVPGAASGLAGLVRYHPAFDRTEE